MIKRVEVNEGVEKSLRCMPIRIAEKLHAWVESIEEKGLGETRKIPGFHDEPLQGKRFGQRSIRLSRAYRAIYRLASDGNERFILVEEVTKHEY